MHLFRRSLIALALGTLLPPALDAQDKGTDKDQSERIEVRELKITGVKSVDKGDLREALATQESSCNSLLLKPFCLVTKSHLVYTRRFLDRQEFERDVIRLLVYYFRRGYRDARVDTSVVNLGGSAVRITMAVNEGPATVVTSAVATGIDGILPPKDTARRMVIKAGEPYSMLLVDSSAFNIRAGLWERGYADAAIKTKMNVDDSTNRGDVIIEIDPKRKVTIGEIKIEGNDEVDERDIRNSLFIRTGDLFRTSRLQRSQRALYESNFFRRAVIDTAPGADTVKNLVIRVIESPLREARTSFGFTTADFVQAEGRFTHHYLFGGARRFDATLTVGNLLAQQLTKSKVFVDISNIVKDNDLGRYYAPTYVASLDMRQRWFESPRNTIGLGIFSHRRSAPGVMVDRGYGANATFTREVELRMPLSATYRFEISRVQAGDVYFCVNYGVCDAPTITALRGQQRLSPLALTLTANRADAPFSPTRGYRFSGEIEHANKYTASDFHYTRAVADIAAYLPLPFRKAVGAAHLRAGWVKPIRSSTDAVLGDRSNNYASDIAILHPRKRFYAGGSQSVRGFGENQLGPRVLTIAPDQLLRGERTITDGDTTFACGIEKSLAECVNEPADDKFQIRPLGGTTLLEGSIELRIPVWGPLVGAVFVDGAILGERSLSNITSGTGAITPGFGVRYESPVGPIRVDLGIRPTLRENLGVITESIDTTGTRQLVDLAPPGGCGKAETPGCRVYPRAGEKQSFFQRLANRLTLHLSIGQAF